MLFNTIFYFQKLHTNKNDLLLAGLTVDGLSLSHCVNQTTDVKMNLNDVWMDSFLHQA